MRFKVLHVRNRSLWFVQCLVLFFVVQYSSVVAQVYPVQASTQLSPPYSLYLADYVEAGTERVALNVFLADVARPQLDVRFRLKIIGQGVTLETKASYIPPPMSIQGGVPLRLISADLADYFNPNNLEFQGMSRNDYIRAGKLPEGAYQFCFEVLEYNRGVKISNTACAMAWMILNDPPLVNLPRQDEKLRATSPQNVVLQWTPRHTASPNSAFTAEYDVTMVEVWPATRNPNDAILTSPPIFETTTTATTLIYGPAETPLEPGRRYAFRIKARSMAGVSQLDLFKNNGYSEVFSFVYGDACDLPTGISTTAISSTRFSVGWESMFNHTAYRIRYREVGTTNWYETNSALSSAEVGSLKPGTAYEYQVAPSCGFFEGQYSPVTRVTTEKAPEMDYACGVPIGTFGLDPTLFTGSLKAGDVIMAGDFDVKVTKVTGSNGTYSGEGVIEVPYFNKAKVKTEFTGITVNKDMRMINGYMNVTGAGVDVIPEGLKDFMDKLDEILDLADSALNKIENSLPESFDEHSFVADTLIKVKDGIADVRKNDDGSVTVYDKNGGSQTIPAGTTAAITDDSGKGYLVDAKGNVHKTSAEVATKAGNREYNLMLQFSPDVQARNGFDMQKYEAITGYETVKGYKVAWKAVAAGSTDLVAAILDAGANIDGNKIQFEQGGSVVSASSAVGSSQSTSVLLEGVNKGEEQGLLAVYTPDSGAKTQVLGKVNVATYAEITKKVAVVPVNGAEYPHDIDVLSDRLNEIYAQAVVKWSVEILEGIDVTLGATFNDGQSGVLSNYTSDMKDVIDFYRNEMEADTYYLFLIPGSTQRGNLGGYMPRNKQAGFIFIDQVGSEDLAIRTVAHELGHGAFNLAHTFEETKFQLPEQTTDNLMDKGSGIALYKYQWDKMRSPDIVIGVFESDASGESTTTNVAFLGYFDHSLSIPKTASKTQYTLSTRACYSVDTEKCDWIETTDQGVSSREVHYVVVSFPKSINHAKVTVSTTCGLSSSGFVSDAALERAISCPTGTTCKLLAVSYTDEKKQGLLSLSNGTKDIASVFVISDLTRRNMFLDKLNTNGFVPTSGKGSLAIACSVMKRMPGFNVGTAETDLVKIEVFSKKNNNLLFTTSVKLDLVNQVRPPLIIHGPVLAKTFNWDGKMNVGSYNGKFIGLDEADFSVKATYGSDIHTEDGSIDKVLAEWDQYPGMQKNVAGGLNGYRSLILSYQIVSDVFKDTPPLKYFTENMINAPFLGKTSVYCHKNYAPTLKSTDEALERIGKYEEVKAYYANKGIGGFGMRRKNATGAAAKEVSGHGFGFAVDVDPRRNAQIRRNESMIRLLMIKSVGFDLGIASGKGVRTVKAAHDKFKTTFNGVQSEEFCTRYEKIQSHINKEGVFVLNDLSSDNLFNRLTALNNATRDRAAKTLSTTEWQVNYNAFMAALTDLQTILPIYENAVVFSDEGIEGLQYAEGYLDKVQRLASGFLTGQTAVDNLSPYKVDAYKLASFVDEVNRFETDFRAADKNCRTYADFGSILRSQLAFLKASFATLLFQDGFFDLDASVVECFLQQGTKFEWGGAYKSKIDPMHLGVKDEEIENNL